MTGPILAPHRFVESTDSPWHCNNQASTPHAWDYNSALHTYRCRHCLLVIDKATLKRLTD